MRRTLALVLGAFLLLLACGAASAQPSGPSAEAQAKSHRDRGLNYFNTGDYNLAAQEFKAAYRIDPQPEFLYGLAQADRLGGDCQAAVEIYKAFLRSNPPEAQAAAAQKNLSQCEAALTAKTSPPIEATPPSALPQAEHAGGAPAPASAVAATPRTRGAPAGGASVAAWYEDPLGLSLVGGGLALALGGGGLYLYAQSQQSSAGSQNEREALGQLNGAWTAVQAAGACEIAGALAIAGGVTRLLLVRGEAASETSDRSAALDVAVGPAGVLVRGTF